MSSDEELKSVIEELIQSKYPQVPKDLIFNLLQIEKDYFDNPKEAEVLVKRAINTYLEGF